MAARFVLIDRETPLLLPPNLRDWVPAGHLAHFIIDAVDLLDLRQIKVNERGTGNAQYPPTMLLGLLIYSYATGTFGSRRIEQSTHDSVPVRLIAADTHPDHDTICTFRRENKALVTESFVKVLEMAGELGVLQFGQVTTAVDGSKVQANASKHSAVSYQWAGQRIEQLELEVRQLLEKAEQADATPLQEGLNIPEEITRRQERKAALEKARAVIEARAHARYAVELAEHEKKMAERADRQEGGKRVGGKPPAAPSPEPEPGDQYNFTDPESRIMKAGSGQHFEQSFNAQAAVEVESRLIIGQRVSDAPNDKQQLEPDLRAIEASGCEVAAVIVDSGFYSAEAVARIERREDGQPSGTVVYAAVEKTGHHRSVADLEERAEPAAPPAGASAKEKMKQRLKTSPGRAIYKLRQQTVEPVFGIIKAAMGFRQFLLRGLSKVTLEWELVCLAYNFRRLHRMGAAAKLPTLS